MLPPSVPGPTCQAGDGLCGGLHPSLCCGWSVEAPGALGGALTTGVAAGSQPKETRGEGWGDHSAAQEGVEGATAG